jgi:hypothetical protein
VTGRTTVPERLPLRLQQRVGPDFEIEWDTVEGTMSIDGLE